ncbi:uncharacterized protein [Chelonus insularis]|uniref:uncharacterized protein n=1 Tax=Chelonus insularis TaxID=460826 RepID=UPI00158B0D02|nr:uncharacterized protein LOC118063966 [Chelonus insularis]
MTSTLTRERMLIPPSSELDSESSSGGDERGELRKRIRDDNDTSSPKKRRKQTTPVRFPASLMSAGEQAESEEEDDDDGEEFENSVNVKGKTLDRSASIRDENLNSEFRCVYCGRIFEDSESASQCRHTDNELSTSNLAQSIVLTATSQGQVRVKLEQEEPESPVNLSNFNIKNLATSWISGQTQSQLSQDSEWSNQNPVTSVASHQSGLPYHVSLSQYLPLPTFPLSDTGQLPRVGPAPIRIFNPDAYCDLCNKEFCNKYFLKTHKANKHGIYVDAPLGQSSNDSNGAQFPSTFFPSPNIKLEQQTQQQPKVEVSMTISTPTLLCDICQKKFKNEEILKKHKQKVHECLDQDSQSLHSTGNDEDRESGRFSPSTMEALMKQDFGIEQEDAKFMPAPRHLSPQSIQQARESGFNADKLRKLGVLNPEAFCEICCKEYCNKYFLQTHKMKRHGIFTQDNEKSPNTPGAAATWHQIQTSPLNLIMANNPAGSESNDKSEEFECKRCGIRFQTFGLYQTHKSKFHENDGENSPKQDIEEERTDSISEDLQKLQTMILQLNGLESSRTVTCGICSRECENKLALKTHMSLEHGTSVFEDPPSPSQLTENSQTTRDFTNTSTFCTLCEKDYKNFEALKQHIAEDHQQISPTSGNSTVIHTPNPTPAPGPPIPPPSDKKITSITPTSSYCEICNKELCNKYFMKTHMQRMHGIEIENGSQIGGVVCNICNKELCSKYFLRVHKHNTHGIIDEGSTSIKPESYDAPNIQEDTSLKPDQLGDLSHRYFSHFTEVCPVCSRRFRSIKWLKAHMLGDHGKVGHEKWRELEQQYQNSSKSRPASANRPAPPNTSLKIPNGLEITQHLKGGDYPSLGNQVLSSLFGTSEEQSPKNYRCSYCNFSTTVLPFLFLHERSHTTNLENINLENGLQCPICSQTFSQTELLHHHLLTRHQFSGLHSQFSSAVINPPTLDGSQGSQERNEIEQKEPEGKDEPIQVSPQVQVSLESNKNKRDEPAPVLVTPQTSYQCAQCGFATANLNRIKKHVKKDHKTMGDPTEYVIAELTRTLRDVANKHKVPASYAIPQDSSSNPDATVMQPFIIEERDCFGDESRLERKFAPVLVYLPVRTRINNVLTASFTLSPA